MRRPGDAGPRRVPAAARPTLPAARPTLPATAAIAAALLAALPGAAPGPGAAAGVKFGDAVPAIIKPSDFERIRGILRLDRFSIIAAVWLGASAGREAVLIEPLPDDVLARVAAACEEGGFCPDPTGFVAARVRIILLRGGDVSEIVRVDGQARAGDRLLFDPADPGAAGDHLGWTGWAEGRDGHVALSLTPIARFEEGVIGAGADPPFLIRWNRKTDRFALYDCVLDEAGRARCAFREPPP